MRFIVVLIVVISMSMPLFSQGYDDSFEMKNKVKVELQYADYGEYEYPEAILFRFGLQEYYQLRPFLANFPERRSLIKFTRTVGAKTAIGVKYQFSDIREDVNSHLTEAKVTTSIRPGLTALVGVQMIYDERGFKAWQPGVGMRWDLSAATTLQADAQYYTRGEDAVDIGGSLGSLNLRCKLRQVLTVSTAMMLEYLFYDADGEAIEFTSHTVSLWLSRFFHTQTAVHLNLRFYDNSLGIQSMAPSIEIGQYLNWATILRFKYRYYNNKSNNISLGESDIVVPDGLKTHAASLQLNRELNSELLGYLKYRYYKSNQGVVMNTYLLGFVYSF
ncbi:hypothetical protein KAR48_13400 [bacterium]|nr:hypothetical protein [bacterium]